MFIKILVAIFIMVILSSGFIGCGEAEKMAQLQTQLENQNRNLQNIQTDLQAEKIKRVQIENAFQKKVDEENENIEIAEVIKDIKPSSDDKIFIREYEYSASEDDSKNSSRKKAITQLKVKLSEEVGTHIESYLKIQKENIGGVAYKSINSEIRSLSSSITKLEILDEKWNGKKYWIKAKVRINEKRTMELLLTAIKSKANEKDVKRLNKILATQKQQLESQNSEVSKMNRKLVAQEIVNEARKNEVVKMKSQLVKYQKEEIKQKKEEIKYSSELERKKALVEKLNKKNGSEFDRKLKKMKTEWLGTKEILCGFDERTSKKDIEEISGKKMKRTSPRYSSYYYYNETRKNRTTGQNDSYEFKSSGHLEYNSEYKANDMHHSNYTQRVCPNTLLQNELSFNCIYFAFEGDLMASRGGCKSKVYK